jgi:hypothetical protein
MCPGELAKGEWRTRLVSTLTLLTYFDYFGAPATILGHAKEFGIPTSTGYLLHYFFPVYILIRKHRLIGVHFGVFGGNSAIRARMQGGAKGRGLKILSSCVIWAGG